MQKREIRQNNSWARNLERYPVPTKGPVCMVAHSINLPDICHCRSGSLSQHINKQQVSYVMTQACSNWFHCFDFAIRVNKKLQCNKPSLYFSLSHIRGFWI